MFQHRHISTRLLLFLIAFTCYFLIASANARKVNCKKYVYAPICRGVASKRSLKENWHKINRPNHVFFPPSIDAPSIILNDPFKERHENGILFSRLMKQTTPSKQSGFNYYNSLR